MNERQWFVSQDDDGYYSIPRAAYPNRLAATAAAYLANKAANWSLEYFADSVPLITGLPRVEHAQRLTVFLTKDGDRLVSDDRLVAIVHLDPDEDNEAPVFRMTHERSWWSPTEVRRAAVKIHAYGTDHELVREAVANREQYLRLAWMPEEWKVTYDVIADQTTTRRRTSGFDTRDAALDWTAKNWRAEKIGPVQLEHWPSGELVWGDKLERRLLDVAK